MIGPRRGLRFDSEKPVAQGVVVGHGNRQRPDRPPSSEEIRRCRCLSLGDGDIALIGVGHVQPALN